MGKLERRCAIYTRKSSEDGLDQSFNSLDAQYEACAAYIASQRHEGWRLLPARYDDGGYSGGSLERPALQSLLTDLEAGGIDLIVVYKIDRLTRSLMDFAQLVERFDRHTVSFVSVTQAFNTTTSMGRLTLNVLLSFAQFEREVTGERIRDKIAASKRKGMWMGGTVPMGYAAQDRTLAVVPEAAAEVRDLYERYRALGSVTALKAELDAAGRVSRTRVSLKGKASGGLAYARGALYLLLKNRVYRGEIPHKGQWYPGHHDAIVPEALWNAVQTQLETHREERRLGGRAKEASLLAGMVVDGDGQRLTPSHTVKAGRRYRYYLGRRDGQSGQDANAAPNRHRRRVTAIQGRAPRRMCVPAHDLERLVTAGWRALLDAADLDVQLGIEAQALSEAIRASAQRLSAAWPNLSLSAQRRALLTAGLEVAVEPTRVRLTLAPDGLCALLEDTPEGPHRTRVDIDTPPLVRIIEAAVIRRYGETRILEDDTDAQARAVTSMHQSLLRSIAQGRLWYQQLVTGEVDSITALAIRARVSDMHVTRTLQCAWLAPDLVERLIDGRADARFSLAEVRAHFTVDWAEQRRRWG